MRKIELLSPAKNIECGLAAVKCGADAVYIGAENFGARAAAGNSLDDIKKLIDFAHFYRAKIYVTVNTIMTDSEILSALKLIEKLYEINVDAVIVQDMGLLELDLPPIPLFASTQTHNDSLEKIKFLEKVGFSRVILARELDLDTIKNINSHSSLELEAFIHGALCVCYSGQCYLSNTIGGRSANRGACAQPCRKKYSLKTADDKFIVEDKHLLSLKDLNLHNYISQMIDAGVTSFKVEGRLKDVNYIKNIISYYNTQLNNIIDNRTDLMRASQGQVSCDFEPNPYKTFNRGYSKYFISGRNKDLASFDTPKSMGEKLGQVIYADKFSFKLNGDDNILHNADGICFLDDNNDLKGTTVNKVENNRIFTKDTNLVKKGYLIYRNYDHEFAKKLENALLERKIPVSIVFSQDSNNFIAEITDGESNYAYESFANTFEPAKNPDSVLQNIIKQMKKLGSTNYFCDDVTVKLENVTFIPVKTLNEIRRNLVGKLDLARENAYARKNHKIVKNDYPYPENHITYLGNVFNTYAKAFYKRHQVEIIDAAAESGIDMSGNVLMTTKYCIKYELGLCHKICKDKNNIANKELYLVDEKNKSYRLEFDCKNCKMKIINL